LIRKLALLSTLLLLLSASAFAQSTTVSGTVTDTPDGQAWFNGTYSFVFRTSPSNPSGQYFWNGVPFSSSQTIAGQLDGSAHYSVSVPSNTSITPAGSTWDLTVCPLATATCFTVQSVSITGTTQTVSPTPPSIRINLSSPPQNPRAYQDGELVNGALGQTYFNITSTVIRVCSVFPCGWTNSSGGTSITLQTNGTINAVQSLLNIKAGTAITTTADGSGGVTIASTIGPPSGAQGVVQAANGIGGDQATNLTETGGVLTNGDQNSNRGPNPSVDITAPPFNARALSTSAIPQTTGTITGGTNSLVVASNFPAFQINDGIALVGGGATNCGTAPAAPTVTPSLASAMTGTGHAVAGATGSTSYSYVVIAVSKGGCYTASSAIGSTSTGNATLGATNIPITSCSNLAGLVTCTVGSTTGLATGMWTRIGGTTDDPEFAGRHNITVLNGTQFTYLSNESSIYPMVSTTATGGTLYFWVENHIVLPTLPAGTNLYKYAVYRCTGASCALPANAANYSLVYISYPANLGFIDVAYNTWDDYGTISTVNSFSTPWFIPTTPPASNVNDMLVTTIANISGTTFTLAASAVNSTSSAPVRFDDAPAIVAAEAASNTASPGGGGSVHIPSTPSVSLFGTTCYITSSYFIISSIVNVGGAFCPGETVELSNGGSGTLRSALFGVFENTISSSLAAFGNQTLPTVSCFGANPCFWRKGATIKNLGIQTSGPGATLVFDSSPNQTLTENAGFSVPDGMGISYHAYEATFGSVFNNTNWLAGPAQVIGAIDTPAYLNRDSIQTTFNNVSGNLRGLYFECTNNPPNSCAFYISVKMGNEWQGNITPLVTTNSVTGGRFGYIYLEHMISDSGSEPLFASQGTMEGTVVINGVTNTGSLPIIGGNQMQGGVSLNIGAGLLAATSVSGMNHDITMCSGQAGSTQTTYIGCALPSLNLATASYAVNHTLTGSEGVVNMTVGGLTVTAPHALAGQTWIVNNPSSGTITTTIDSGTLFGNGATGPITIPTKQGLIVNCDGTNCYASGIGAFGSCSPGGSIDALLYNGGGGSCAGVNSPTVNGNYLVNYNVIANAAVPPTITLPGVPQNPQTGTTYTYLYSDRGAAVSANNAGPQTYTLVNPSSTGFGSNYFNVLRNIGTGAVTEGASGFTINGGASLLVPPSWLRWLWSDGVNYSASRVPEFGAFQDCHGGGNALQFTASTGAFSCGSSSAGVSSFSGDGALLSNSLSTGAVIATLANAGAHKFWMNNTGISAAPGYQSPGKLDLLATIVYTDQANTYSAGLQDFSAVTLKITTGAGFTAGATTMFGYDSTNKNVHIYANNADAINLAIASAPTNGDALCAGVTSGNVLATDCGYVGASVVTAASAASAAKQTCVSSGASKTCTYIDFPERYFIPAANCNNTTAGAGWSIGSGGTATCRAGTNNKGGYVAITDTSTTFAQFTITIPEDWDTGTNPSVRFYFGYPGTDTGHTIIPAIQVTCSKGDGTTTDDVTFNAAHSSSTTTTNATANQFWSNSNVTMNSTDVTGCVAGAPMTISVQRATDTATSAVNFYGVDVTFPRLLTVGAE
jgi:hypothetical protein